MIVNIILAPIFKIVDFLPRTMTAAYAEYPLRARVRALAEVAKPFTEVEAAAMEERNAERRRAAIEALGSRYVGLPMNQRTTIEYPPLPTIEPDVHEFIRKLRNDHPPA